MTFKLYIAESDVQQSGSSASDHVQPSSPQQSGSARSSHAKQRSTKSSGESSCAMCEYIKKCFLSSSQVYAYQCWCVGIRACIEMHRCVL